MFFGWMASLEHKLRPLLLVIKVCSAIIETQMGLFINQIVVELMWKSDTFVSTMTMMMLVGWQCRVDRGRIVVLCSTTTATPFSLLIVIIIAR